MDPRDFLQIARDILGNDKPANCRTAFNRSYYAAYHVGVELLEQAGVKISRSAKGHNDVTTFLNNCGEKDLVVAQQKLVNLYNDRIKADYRLNHKSVEKIVNAKKALKTSENIIKTFDSFTSNSEKQKIAKRINNYLNKISR
jgi:hypothetical protein